MKLPYRYAVAASLLIVGALLVYLAISRQNSGRAPVEPDLTAALQTSSVEVNNGEAAVLRNPQGYVLLVPVKRTLQDLRLSAYVSKSGVFAQDAVRVFDEDCRVDRRINVGGSEVLLEGGSDSSVYVTLGIGDANTRIALSKTSALRQVNASNLVFNGNSEFDRDKAFERFKARNGMR